MTTLARGWNRLTLPGKIVFTAIPVLIAAAIGLIVVLSATGTTGLVLGPPFRAAIGAVGALTGVDLRLGL